MSAFLEVVRTGPVSVLLHPLRSTVTVVAVGTVLVPYLVGLGLVEGLRQEAQLSIGDGSVVVNSGLPDLYVSGNQFGRRVPIPVQAVEEIARMDGVTKVVSRIVGRIPPLGNERIEAVLVGMPRAELERIMGSPGTSAQLTKLVDGKLPCSGTGDVPELVLGSELARRLDLDVGDVLPPISRTSGGDKTPRITGIFRSDISFWQARLILTTFETATDVFDQPGQATDLLVYCQAGQPRAVENRIRQSLAFSGSDGTARIVPSVTSRDELKSMLPAGLGHREGVFNLHFVLAFVVGILVILVTSGFGLPERRREIGILKATGWQTDEILLRGLVESFLLGVAGAAGAILLAYAWLEWLNGYWIAGIFLAGVDSNPGFPVPYVLAPVPILLAGLLACVLVMSGTAYSSWRAAVTPPAEAMR